MRRKALIKTLDYKEALQGNDEPIKEELQVLAQEFIDTVRKKSCRQNSRVRLGDR
jgi:hypothetical protein